MIPHSVFISFLMLIAGTGWCAQAETRTSVPLQNRPPTASLVKTAQAIKAILIPDEDHGSQFMLVEELEKLSTLRQADASYDCVFLEVEPKAEKAIESFLSGQPYDLTVKQWIAESSQIIGRQFVNIIPNWYLNSLKELRYRVFGADVAWDSKDGREIIPLIEKVHADPDKFYEFAPLLVERRSQIMAERISKALSSGLCQKAALVVGSGHLDPGNGKPVQAYLKALGILSGVWR